MATIGALGNCFPAGSAVHPVPLSPVLSVTKIIREPSRLNKNRNGLSRPTWGFFFIVLHSLGLSCSICWYMGLIVNQGPPQWISQELNTGFYHILYCKVKVIIMLISMSAFASHCRLFHWLLQIDDFKNQFWVSLLIMQCMHIQMQWLIMERPCCRQLLLNVNSLMFSGVPVLCCPLMNVTSKGGHSVYCCRCQWADNLMNV